jgi:hypothetical protein
MLQQIIRSFLRRNEPGILGNKFVANAVYLILCRIMNKRGQTVGEELVFGSSSEKPDSLSQRTKLLLGALSVTALKEVLLPIVMRNSSDVFSTLAHICARWVLGGIFFFNQKARAPSLIENALIPKHPSRQQDISRVIIPRSVFYIAGFSEVLKTITELRGLFSRRKLAFGATSLDYEISYDSITRPSAGSCPICMCEISRPTATVCGHIFCWDCSIAWVVPDGKPCPICRTVSLPQDLLPLTSYAPSKAEWKPFWVRPLFLDS